ncbi:unnamed protein product [Acanthosepion pharaonis]|uniref:Uncharacterized protein n=1 Tax=Acanthosepion pharaonis TaxID=158019 RepID=A0A812CCR6_ACAPH|nr:unnamed protein product [Sepia pharaonis]
MSYSLYQSIYIHRSFCRITISVSPSYLTPQVNSFSYLRPLNPDPTLQLVSILSNCFDFSLSSTGIRPFSNIQTDNPTLCSLQCLIISSLLSLTFFLSFFFLSDFLSFFFLSFYLLFLSCLFFLFSFTLSFFFLSLFLSFFHSFFLSFFLSFIFSFSRFLSFFLSLFLPLFLSSSFSLFLSLLLSFFLFTQFY